jgi:hypothetical protein
MTWTREPKDAMCRTTVPWRTGMSASSGGSKRGVLLTYESQ